MNPDVKRHESELGWTDLDGLYKRNYTDYNAYIKMQASKLDERPGWCLERSRQLRQLLQSRLKQLRIVKHGMSVLCLGARLGGEVEAFINMGAFAVGIDVNPGPANQHVVYGDFHDLEFADSSVDIVYINCFDHCLEPDKVLAQIHRVLKPEGILQMECKSGSNEIDKKNMGSDHWDCLEWDSLKVLVERIEQSGYSLFHSYHDRQSKATPYGYLFRKNK